LTLRGIAETKQNEDRGMNSQKNHESTKEHNSKSQKFKFVMIFVSRCQYKFSNIHCCHMSKADAGLDSDYNKKKKWNVLKLTLTAYALGKR
jgi:hypothetical protein